MKRGFSSSSLPFVSVDPLVCVQEAFEGDSANGFGPLVLFMAEGNVPLGNALLSFYLYGGTIITVAPGFVHGLIATFTLSSLTLLTEMGCSSGPETIAHSTGIILLLFSVSIPPVTGNFIIPCVVDGTACIFRNPGLPMIPLCGDVDLTTMKSIHVDVECSYLYFHRVLSVPNGPFYFASRTLIYEVVSGTIYFFISGRSLLKQCS
ncbi:hypothetical protein Tco_0972644 [Tanacetum coccineum]